MGGFFRLDGPFFKYGTILCDLMILSAFWTIFSLPVITLGPATAALYYVTTRLISQHEGYVTKDFIKSFVGNFIQAAIALIILTAAGVIIYFNIYYLNMSSASGIWNIALILQYVLELELIITSFYVFPMIARFRMGIFNIIKTAFFLANRHIFTTITCLALFCASFIICFYIYPIISLFFVPGAYAYLTSFMIMRVFKKYNPEMDADISADGKNILEEKHRLEKEEEERNKKLSQNNEDTVSDVSEDIEDTEDSDVSD